MKKKTSVILIVAAIMIVSLTACFAGCGGTSGRTPEQIQEAGTLIIATNAAFPPFEYTENGEYLGWDMDIARAFADLLGVEVQIRNMEFDSVLSAVATGQADIAMAGISFSEERDKTVDFSEGVFNSSQMIIVRSEDTSINGPMDLAGKVVGAQRGTVGHLLAQLDEDWAFDENGNAILGQPSTVLPYGTAAEAVQALAQGSLDAVILDQMPAEAIVAQRNGDVKILEKSVFDDEYAFAVAEGNSALAEWINNAIATLKENGTWDEITDKYFSEEGTPNV